MYRFFLISLALFISKLFYAQADTLKLEERQFVRVIQDNKNEFLGYIIEQNEREVFIELTDGRRIYIPQYVIREIIPIDLTDFNNKGEFVGDDLFATRYFITTNGLPLEAGQHYVQWNLYGPDFQFAISKRFGVGFMTSWLAVPLIGTAKYSFTLNDRNQFAIGTLIGTSSWAAFSGANFGGALPFATYSHGDRVANFALSGGYGAVWFDGDLDGRALTSVAGMIKIGPRISLVFDSFIILKAKSEFYTYTYTDYIWNDQTGQYDEIQVTSTQERKKPAIGIFIPGIRWHQDDKKAFQFGFTGIAADGMILPTPIPMVQWYRRL